MAINKVVNKSTKTHGAMRNVIAYVLRNDKVKEGYVDITGPYEPEIINWDNVYQAFLREKRLWGKDTGRMYAHNIISFHKDEIVTPEVCMSIGRAFADKFFAEHQNLIGVHQDKDHLHCHIVTNSVSYDFNVVAGTSPIKFRVVFECKPLSEGRTKVEVVYDDNVSSNWDATGTIKYVAAQTEEDAD